MRFVAEKTATIAMAITMIRSALGAAWSLNRIQRARLRQRPTRLRRMLQSRRICALGGGKLVARGEDIGMIGALTFFLRQLHEWRAIPARASLAFRYGELPTRQGRRR